MEDNSEFHNYAFKPVLGRVNGKKETISIGKWR